MATPQLMAFTTGAFYTAGGTGGALTTLASWSHLGARGAGLLVLCLLGLVMGLLLLRWGRLLPRWVQHVVVAQATLMLAAGVVLSADDGAALAIAGCFVFCAVDTVYFFTRRAAAAHHLLLLGAITLSLRCRGVDPGVVAAVLIVQVVVAVVVDRLVQRAEHGVQDSLTGLPNRRGFDEKLQEAVTAAHRGRTALCLALLDVDHFKDVNDRCGHAAGDELLTSLARRLTRHLPAGALLARHGGDEFVLLATRTDLAAATRLAEGLRGVAAPTGVSIGVAQLGPREDPGTLVRRADAALYEAKAAGRGRVSAAAANDAALAHDLRACLEATPVGSTADNGLHTVLQPIVVPGTGELVGVEALARWTHPTRGPVSPAQFVPLAEATGLIGALDTTVARQACAAASWLSAQLDRRLLLTVNVSGRHLVDPDFHRGLVQTLSDTGWRPQDLVVVVTESVVEAASHTARTTLEGVRALGVRVAIDDFGTGYSAFSQLDELPADYLKLDTRFTSQITSSSRRRAVLGGLLRMSADLGMLVVAEGVETTEQEQELADLGCPLAQGFLFARPLPAAELLHRLRSAAPRTRGGRNEEVTTSTGVAHAPG